MKTTLLLLSLAIPAIALSQEASKPPLSVTIVVRNEVSGRPVDANLTWPDESKVRKTGRGMYIVSLAPEQSEVLTITRDGYFDTNLKLDYTVEETTAYHEIRLKPGVPQLDITITSTESTEPLKAAVDLFTIDEKSIVFSEAVETSPYIIDLEYNQVHVLQVRAPGYFSFKDTIDFSGVFDGRVRTKQVVLVPLRVGNKISLQNIYFTQGSSDLTDFAKLMLVELTHVLATAPRLKLEIGAHTDDVGATEFNQSLSEKRALAVRSHLIEKGVKAAQLIARGYGETSPLAANDSETSRALNRRVEFKILETD